MLLASRTLSTIRGMVRRSYPSILNITGLSARYSCARQIRTNGQIRRVKTSASPMRNPECKLRSRQIIRQFVTILCVLRSSFSRLIPIVVVHRRSVPMSCHELSVVYDKKSGGATTTVSQRVVRSEGPSPSER
jgi:hypothetical protein